MLTAIAHTSYSKSITASDSTIMRCEADEFLASMPANLQQSQCKAVRLAINGDNSALNEVRHSRNSKPEISEGVKAADFTITGVDNHEIPVRLLMPTQNNGNTDLPLLIYFHGGGWTFGSINSCTRFCDALAAKGCMAVMAVEYRLAPEHPFPEGLYDCISALKFAFSHGDELGISPSLISLGGDSAGGNLALATALYNNDNDRLPVKSIVTFYPVTRADNKPSHSWETYGEGFGLDSQLMDAFNDAYALNDKAKTNAEYISPLLADDIQLRQLPETLMINAECDILHDQGAEFASRVEAAGGDIHRFVLPGTVHLFITVNGQPTAFDKSVEMTAAFLKP